VRQSTFLQEAAWRRAALDPTPALGDPRLAERRVGNLVD
jgi:hypothetical protein